MFILAISLFSFSLPYCITAPVCFTMVTPSNVLVPPLWHFILLHHPLPSAFPSRHTGITLIMIMAVMIMITTAKLHSLSLSPSYPTPRRLWLTERLPANVSPISFFLLSSISLCRFFFLPYFTFSGFPRSLHSLFILQLTSCLFSVFVKFQPVFHLCSFQPSLVHLTSTTCPQFSPSSVPVSSPYIFSSLSLHSSPLRPLYSAPTKEDNTFDALLHSGIRHGCITFYEARKAWTYYQQIYRCAMTTYTLHAVLLLQTAAETQFLITLRELFVLKRVSQSNTWSVVHINTLTCLRSSEAFRKMEIQLVVAVLKVRSQSLWMFLPSWTSTKIARKL